MLNLEWPQLAVYKLEEDAPDLKVHTRDSACFDIPIYIKESVIAYNSVNDREDRYPCRKDRLIEVENSLDIPPLYKVCLRTGYILNIPRGYSVRIFARSSTPLKRGLILANGVGIVDSDYTDELMLIMANISNTTVRVDHGDRLAQGEMVENFCYNIMKMNIKPTRKTDRDGGMGSTGK